MDSETEVRVGWACHDMANVAAIIDSFPHQYLRQNIPQLQKTAKILNALLEKLEKRAA